MSGSCEFVLSNSLIMLKFHSQTLMSSNGNKNIENKVIRKNISSPYWKIISNKFVEHT